MNKKASYAKVTVPTLFVTKDKHRVKQYNDVIYLKDGDEFELELFNPTSKKVLAKIKLNDQDLGSGIVLRPGERVFLERYLNEARKFIFETYEVDKSDQNVQRAIQGNGKVEVDFFQEDVNPGNIIYGNGSGTYTYPNPPNWNQPHWTTEPSFYYAGNTGDVTFRGDGYTTLTSNCMVIGCGESKSMEPEMSLFSANFQETGRVEKGDHSAQQLEFDSTKFNSWPSWSSKWTIMPKSQKAFVKEDLGIFCTGCGAKRKKPSHKFCPSCGNKF
jgi:hypothetical protein